MKHKLGPLPLWAWVLIAGGTLGIFWYLRTPSAATTTTSGTVDDSLPATAGGLDTSGGGSTTTAADPTDPTGTTLDDVMAQLMGISSDVATLQGGGQGLTDAPDPVSTWTGEVTDVTSGVKAVASLANLFAPKAAPKTTAQKKTTTAKKKSQGSGSAGKAKATHKTPVRRTTKHKAAVKPVRRPTHPATSTHKTIGGNAQPHRTARPKAKAKKH